MKITLIFISTALCILCSCKNKNSCGQYGNEPGTEFTGSTAAVYEEVKTDSSKDGKNVNKSTVDLDLTAFSKTAAYAQIFDMIIDGDSYAGKIVKLQGEFYSNIEEQFNKRFYSCVIYDATACCQVGLNFIWTGEHSYPLDYPAEGSRIEIQGQYIHGHEGEMDYFYVECNEVKPL